MALLQNSRLSGSAALTFFVLTASAALYAAETAPSALASDPSGWLDLMPAADLQGWSRVPVPRRAFGKTAVACGCARRRSFATATGATTCCYATGNSETPFSTANSVSQSGRQDGLQQRRVCAQFRGRRHLAPDATATPPEAISLVKQPAGRNQAVLHKNK